MRCFLGISKTHSSLDPLCCCFISSRRHRISLYSHVTSLPLILAFTIINPKYPSSTNNLMISVTSSSSRDVLSTPTLSAPTPRPADMLRAFLDLTIWPHLTMDLKGFDHLTDWIWLTNTELYILMGRLLRVKIKISCTVVVPRCTVQSCEMFRYLVKVKNRRYLPK